MPYSCSSTLGNKPPYFFLLEILLKPFLTEVEIYLRDDTLSQVHIERFQNTHDFDIVSLYSNIPHDFGPEAISFWLDKYPELIANRYNKTYKKEY